MKKGFTLAELIGVIVLIAAIALVSGVVVTKSLKNSKQQLYDAQIDMIKTSMATLSDDYKPGSGYEYHFTLSQLKKLGVIDINLKNPLTGDFFANDMLLKIKNEDGVVSYEVVPTGNCSNSYLTVPKLDFDEVVFVEINSTYNDSAATAKDSNGNVISGVVTSGNVNTSILGTNYITYSINDNDVCNVGIKNVVVVDSQAPVISFNGDLSVSLSQVNSFDFLSDVTVTDNSLDEPTITVEKNFSALRGTYSIRYVAVDASGNIASKYRKVTVN